MSHPQNDIYYEALKEAEQEKDLDSHDEIKYFENLSLHDLAESYDNLSQ